MKTLLDICILVTLASHSIAQRVAPGVPPQHYEHPPAYQQQQYQPPPQPNYQQHNAPPNVNPQQYQPHQQVPVQNVDQYGNVIPQQQPPAQQHQQPPQAGQPSAGHHQQPQAGHQQAQAGHHQQPQGGHHHGHHGQPQQVLHTGNMQDEKAHIAEHMEVPIDTSKMSDQELQFHYFKMHDADNNNKLDGCELIKSLIHWHAQGSKENVQEQVPQVEEKIFTDEELNTLIDPILQSDDLNKDGFIDYPEFIRAQQKSAANNNINHDS